MMFTIPQSSLQVYILPSVPATFVQRIPNVFRTLGSRTNVACSLGEGSAYFLSAIDTGRNKRTASYCSSIAQDSIKGAKETYDCNAKGVVTNSDKTMAVMKQ